MKKGYRPNTNSYAIWHFLKYCPRCGYQYEEEEFENFVDFVNAHANYWKNPNEWLCVDCEEIGGK